MYRILHDAHEVRERRNQLRHPRYEKPELLATAPNQVWSWDITKLLGTAKWTYYYYLYVILDIYSRYTVGWLPASRENADLARAADSRRDQERRRRRGPTDHPQRPWSLDNLAYDGATVEHVGRDQVALPAPRFQLRWTRFTLEPREFSC